MDLSKLYRPDLHFVGEGYIPGEGGGVLNPKLGINCETDEGSGSGQPS